MKIPEYSNVSTLDQTDLFIVETKNGTKNITSEKLKELIGGEDIIKMTWEEYQALSDDEKKDGKVRYITDYPSGGGGGGTGDGSAYLKNDLVVTQSVGGITIPKTYPKGTDVENVLTDMLSPVLYPTFTNPSATLTATGDKLLEAGSTLDTVMTITFNRGKITPAYGTSGNLAGPANGYSLNGGVTTKPTATFNVTVTDEFTNYKGTVLYDQGEQPKDSAGRDYLAPLAAGSVDTNTISYEFVNAFWSNVSEIGTLKKEALVSKSAKVKEFNFPATTETYPEVFDVPTGFNVTAVEVLNTLSNQWEDASDQFTTSGMIHTNAAYSVNYTRYTCNLGMALGARSVRVKWS